jgi:hypothetical protein
MERQCDEGGKGEQTQTQCIVNCLLLMAEPPSLSFRTKGEEAPADGILWQEGGEKE